MAQDKVAANLRRNAAYRTRHPERRWETVLKSRHGITRQVFEAQRLAQDNKCAICRKEFTKTPHVDHSHVTLEIRGLLCGKCNQFIGLADENLETLKNAIEYLEVHGVGNSFYRRAYEAGKLPAENVDIRSARVGEDNLYGDGS